MTPTIDPTKIIQTSRANTSECPVTTARYFVEIVVNEDNPDDNNETHITELKNAIQLAIDNGYLTSIRYDELQFNVVSREVLDIAPPNGTTPPDDITQQRRDQFTNGYIEAALWAECDDQNQPLDQNFTHNDIHPDALTQIKNDCELFFDTNIVQMDEIEDDKPDIYARHGHDYFLTRNGAGAGFWDRGYGKTGEYLTKQSKNAGESHLYVGDDKKLHVG